MQQQPATPDPRPPSADGGGTSGAPTAKRGGNGFQAFLVARPVTVLMLFLTLAGTGLISYFRIPLTLLPRGLSSTDLDIVLPFPGASPSEVEDQLTRPVEEALRTIPGIVEVFSVSSEDAANITVEFSATADMDIAYGEVRDRIERVRPQLPKEMVRYRIRRFNSNTDMPVMWIGVQYDDTARDPFGPIEKLAVPRLEGVEGVARVGLFGLVDEAVRIFVDVDKARGYGINLGDVIQNLQQDNFTLPAGRIDDGERRFALRIDGRFRDMDEIRRYPVGNGRVLGDIAEVVRARAYRDSVWRIGGQPAVGMSISRESDQNTIEVCNRIEAAIEELRADPRMSGVTFNVFFSQKEAILEAIGGLKSSALWGGVFAVLVLWFFLRDLRLTLIASLAIPASLLAALMAVYFGGQTLNLISLTGFTLGIGMLVDNAVVVIENIASRRADGLERHEACTAGAGEVGLAVLASTLTSVVVFLPLVFMDGDRNTRTIMREVGLPISWSLIASLVVAVGFLPSFTARLMKRGIPAPVSGVGGAHGRLGRFYRRSLAWTLDHRLAAFGLLMVTVVLTNMAADAIPEAKSGNNEDGGVTMQIEMPSTYLLADANKVFHRFEAWAAEKQEEFGCEFFSAEFDRHGGELSFYPRRDQPRAVRDGLEAKLRESAPVLPGVRTTVGYSAANGDRSLRVNLEGPDFGVLAAIADDLKGRLSALMLEEEGKARPLLDNVRTDLERGLDEVLVHVDRDRASELGVGPETIRGVVAWGLGGQRLPDLAEGDRDIRVLIEYGHPGNEEESLEFLRALSLPRAGGEQVPLVSVADLTFGKAVGALVRRNGRTSTGISALPAADNLYLVSGRIEEVLRNYPFPEGVTWNEEGGREEFQEDIQELLSTLMLSVVLVYLVMAILLESTVLPLSIMLSIPLAIMGVDLTLWATGYARDEMVYIGLILLAGVVVNNAIVLLDHVQHLRRQGLPRREALIRGGADRLRPILMTALTTIFGLLPMALPEWFPGEGSGSGYEGMAVTVAGGLAFSTVLTLVVVPLFYTYFDDLTVLSARLWPWRVKAASGAPAAGAAYAAPGPATASAAIAPPLPNAPET